MIRSGVLCALITFLLTCSLHSNGAIVSEHLYINSDTLECVAGIKIPYKAFNETPQYSEQNAILQLTVGDSIDLWVVNQDTIAHQFEIKGIGATLLSIPAGDSAQLVMQFNTAGVYIFHDPLNYPTQTYLGLAGMLCVKDHTQSSFYWNIKEHQSDWNTTLVNGGIVDWLTYSPNLFTINGNSNPDINTDAQARIIGNVGDTLVLYITNTGQGVHSMHFHGYHAEVLFSSKFPSHVGRSKDTFPIYPMEGIVLRVVPDKPGEYPIHDHNLVAVSGYGMYPYGMFTTILISQ